MDQSEQSQKLQTSTQLNQNHEFLKKTLQFVVPVVSLLSFLLSYSLGFSTFFQYFHYRFSTPLFPLFTHSLDRIYIFLLCNAILAFLVKNSAFSTLHSTAEFDNTSDEQEAKSEPEVSKTKAVFDEDKVLVNQEEEEDGCLNAVSEDAGDLMMGSEKREGGDVDEVVEEKGCLVKESVGEEGNEVVDVNIEELNRKFDEFIRKMKEKIRIEAQRPLVAA